MNVVVTHWATYLHGNQLLLFSFTLDITRFLFWRINQITWMILTNWAQKFKINSQTTRDS